MNNDTYNPDVITADDIIAMKHRRLEQHQMTEAERNEKVFNLCVELADAQAERKSVMKAHTENIKRIKAEIKELVIDDQHAHNVG